MAKQNSPDGNYVKKEIMLIVALIALVIGFLGGIFYSAFQSGPTGNVQTASGPARPPPAATTVTTKPLK